MEQDILFELKEVSKTYTSNNQSVHAIRNLTANITKGDFTVIMGSSGSGKSTLLYLLSGMDALTSGEIVYQNEPIQRMKEKQLLMLRKHQFGMVYQGIHLVPYLTLLENVVITAKLVNKNHNQAVEKSKALLTKLDLQNEMDRLPAQVSGGQQQRGAIARALVNECKVLFADEPTGALNTAQGQNLLDILSHINREGKSIVMVTHDLKAACRGNRVLFIKDGKIEGEMKLEKYDEQAAQDEREAKIYQFLRLRGW